MTPFETILLIYVISLVLSLTVNNIVLWETKDTVKDLLFPPEGLIEIDYGVLLWIPFYNIFISVMYIITGVLWLLDKLFTKTFSKILNIKIKHNKSIK